MMPKRLCRHARRPCSPLPYVFTALNLLLSSENAWGGSQQQLGLVEKFQLELSNTTRQQGAVAAFSGPLLNPSTLKVARYNSSGSALEPYRMPALKKLPPYNHVKQNDREGRGRVLNENSRLPLPELVVEGVSTEVKHTSARKKKHTGEALLPSILPQQTLTEVPGTGFVSFSAFRLAPSKFAVAGLGRTSGPANGVAASGGAPGSCAWESRGGDVEEGLLTYTTLGENHVSSKGPMLYELVVLFCELSTGVGKGKSATGGRLMVRLGSRTFSPYAETQPVKVHSVESRGPFPRTLVFCSAPMRGNLDLGMVAQWVDYHLFYVGFDLLTLYMAAPMDLTPLQRFLDHGVMGVVDFQLEAKFRSWAHGQGLAMHDCLYGNRETAAWIAYGDFDEYLEAVFKPPVSIKAFLTQQAQAAASPAWVSHGTLNFYNYCEGSVGGHFLVENVPYRESKAFCQRIGDVVNVDADVCPASLGRRKVFANPRKVELMRIHAAFKVASDDCPMNQTGIDLRARDQVRHGHFRSIARQGQWCRKRKRDVQKLEPGELDSDPGIASIAARARECAQRMPVPAFECKMSQLK